MSKNTTETPAPDRRGRPLSATFVSKIRRPGTYGDGWGGHGLRLRVAAGASGRIRKTWIQRLRIAGRITNLGLGPYPIVTLKEAREKAFKNKQKVHRGVDPREPWTPTFEAAAEKVIALHSEGWKNPALVGRQWRQSLRDYAYERIGGMPVDEITPADVLAILKPIWTKKVPTARSVLRRIGVVMKWAAAEGYRTDDPTEAVVAALPKNGGQGTRNHHAAVPHREVRDTIRAVRASTAPDTARRALEFLILTAARTVEVRGATWDEIDLEAGVWTIPAERMKTKREHRVPLSAAALDVIKDTPSLLREAGGFLFQSPRKPGQCLGASALASVRDKAGIKGTVHGFRSSFRDWAAENTDYSSEVVEAALAHVVRNQVEAAYRRTDLFERRRKLMEEWGEYAVGKQEESR